LHQAAFHGRYEMAKTLISLRAPLNLHSNPCGRGSTGIPLELARGGGHNRIADMIHAAMNGDLPPPPPKPPPSPQGSLTIVAARYGWTDDLWSPSTCSHQAGVKDVTDIVQGDIVNGNELHINPDCRGQYMNQHFWPETARGPAIARHLSVKYKYDGGPIQTKTTAKVGNETVALHVTAADKTSGAASSEKAGAKQDFMTGAPPMILVKKGDVKQFIFDKGDLDALRLGDTVELRLASHRGKSVGRKYGEERRHAGWRYTESGVGVGTPVRVSFDDAKFLKLADADLVFDVSFWKMEPGVTVNFVGGTSTKDKTKLGGGGRDFVLNSDGTIACKYVRERSPSEAPLSCASSLFAALPSPFFTAQEPPGPRAWVARAARSRLPRQARRQGLRRHGVGARDGSLQEERPEALRVR
jgi:hypothetical protein